jgi:integrase
VGTWHDPDLGRPIAAPLERCAELLGVDLATVHEPAANVEPYIRADGTRVWSLMQLERQLRPEAYGRRRGGELLALRWEDVDLDKGMLRVRGTLRRTQEGLSIGTPKTPASRRKVVLSPASVTALRRHRARQEQERQYDSSADEQRRRPYGPAPG